MRMKVFMQPELTLTVQGIQVNSHKYELWSRFLAYLRFSFGTWMWYT